MKSLNITTAIKSYSFDELSSKDRMLVQLAQTATERAYSPYSHFSVGAAIELDNGQIVTGANQENAAYPSGLCAERTAAFYAHAQYPEAKFVTIAVAARNTDGQFIETPIAPCGACRQSLLEYETLSQHPVRVLLIGRSEVYELPSVAATLPLAFSTFK